MKIGIYTILFNDRPLEKVAKYLSDLGYEAVEIAAEKRSNHLDMDKALENTDYRKELKKVLTDHGLELVALGNHFDGQLVLGPHDETTDAWAPYKDPEAKIKFGTEQMKKTARVAALLDVPVVVGFVGSQVWGKWYMFPPDNERLYEQAWELFAERWSKILDVYKKEGVKFALEVHPTEIAYNIETAERALQMLDHREEFGFTLDPSHFVWQLIDPVIFVKKFADRIYYVHAKDSELQTDELPRSGVIPTGPWNRIDRGFRFRVPGWGNINWKRLITVLCEIGYNGVISYEHEDPVISREDGCEKCIEFLRPLIIKNPLKKEEWGSWWKKSEGKK